MARRTAPHGMERGAVARSAPCSQAIGDRAGSRSVTGTCRDATVPRRPARDAASAAASAMHHAPDRVPGRNRGPGDHARRGGARGCAGDPSSRSAGTSTAHAGAGARARSATSGARVAGGGIAAPAWRQQYGQWSGACADFRPSPSSGPRPTGSASTFDAGAATVQTSNAGATPRSPAVIARPSVGAMQPSSIATSASQAAGRWRERRMPGLRCR